MPTDPDRRRFLAASGLALGGLALPGCATTSGRAAAPRGCLPRVDVSASRVIRSIAGLRPYRPTGFVVRAGPLADKRLVHNYGHGGAGITLSWGSSRIAVDLGLPGHSGPVAVIGAGIMGLSTARLIQEAGFPVTIYTEKLPPETTSNIAGGQFHPFGHFRSDQVTPEWRGQFAAATDYSWRRFQIMVGSEYGIRWLPTYTEAREPEASFIPNFPPVNRVLAAHEHPFSVGSVVRYDTLYVEVGRYLRQLLRDIQIAGGRIAVRRFGTPAEVAALPERLVFNCTGIGARALFDDRELRPARGQLAILLPQDEVRYAYTFNAGYMFPREDGILLGGTFDLDDWSTEPDPGTTEQLIASHAAVNAAFRCTA